MRRISRRATLRLALPVVAGRLLGQPPDPETAFYAPYAEILERWVDRQGMVDYRSLKTRRQPLDAFAGAISRLEASLFDQWSREAKIAFWINCYNAFTLQAILDHYPIQSSFLASLRFPENSIRQISGVWDTLRFQVMGQPLTLDEIEHEILRPQFKEARIHMALVCAAMGCPPLRNEPYRGSLLQNQLDDQTRRFLSSRDKFRLDRHTATVHLSRILDWYAEDFLEPYGTQTAFPAFNSGQRAVLNFVSLYLPADDRLYLRESVQRVAFLDYDWSLNEQRR